MRESILDKLQNQIEELRKNLKKDEEIYNLFGNRLAALESNFDFTK